MPGSQELAALVPWVAEIPELNDEIELPRGRNRKEPPQAFVRVGHQAVMDVGDDSEMYGTSPRRPARPRAQWQEGGGGQERPTADDRILQSLLWRFHDVLASEKSELVLQRSRNRRVADGS